VNFDRGFQAMHKTITSHQPNHHPSHPERHSCHPERHSRHSERSEESIIHPNATHHPKQPQKNHKKAK